jgi:hypothetical protein
MYTPLFGARLAGPPVVMATWQLTVSETASSCELQKSGGNAPASGQVASVPSTHSTTGGGQAIKEDSRHDDTATRKAMVRMGSTFLLRPGDYGVG